MKQRHFTALISGMILVSALSLTGCAEKQQPSPQPEVTEAQAASIGLYSFSAETLDGSVFTQEDLSGRDLTVINFWSVTCGPCIAEMPDLAEFADRLPSNIQVLTAAGRRKRRRRSWMNPDFTGIPLLPGTGIS